MKKFEWSIFSLLIILLIIGIVSIYSASSTKIGDDFLFTNYYVKQIIWIIISMIVFFLLLKAPNAAIEISIFPLYFFTLLLLVLVLFLPEIKGSHRWINLGSIHFQPSELAKLMTIMVISRLISKPFLSSGQILFRTFIVTLIPITLILLEPDLGTALTFFVILFSILLVSDLPKFYLILIISPILSIIFSFSIWLFIFYLLLLIYILYRSNLDKVIIGFVLAINTFIFSVIGEEFGFFGCTFILVIYFLFLYKIALSIIKIKRKEYRFVSIGILAYITFQIFINIGMNLGIVPTTGIPLPFISYGGSNLLINVTAIGFILKYLNERSIFA